MLIHIRNSLPNQQRFDYTNAALYLKEHASNTPSTLAPVAKSRYDDWVATHMNQTEHIHYTGNFLVWHHYFTWIYEHALRTECGYDGFQPYWDWLLTANGGLETSSIFDGSATSIVRTLLEPDIYSFEIDMQGNLATGDLGVHGGSHWTIGGDAGDDLHVSPGHPMFYLHHTMINRTWWMWQMLDPYPRIYVEDSAVSGTGIFLNILPSAN
jgi:hypothetical protein